MSCGDTFTLENDPAMTTHWAQYLWVCLIGMWTMVLLKRRHLQDSIWRLHFGPRRFFGHKEYEALQALVFVSRLWRSWWVRRQPFHQQLQAMPSWILAWSVSHYRAGAEGELKDQIAAPWQDDISSKPPSPLLSQLYKKLYKPFKI